MPPVVARLGEGTWEERFWKYLPSICEDDECWEWTGSRDQHGYGRIQLGGRNGILKAHRASFLIHNRELPTVVRHRCDNPPCVNPAHLLAGTMKDNTADMLARGRESRQFGDENPKTKLPNATVVAIRERAAGGASDAQVAREFGLTEKYTCALVTGRRRAAAGGPIREPDDVRWTVRARVLRYMDDDADGPVTARGLERDLGIPSGRTILRSMRGRGLVIRIPESGGSPRAAEWVLTEAGSRAAGEARP